MKKQPLKLYDIVALLKDFPEKKVVFGQVGTVVEMLKDDFFEIEFSDKSGETIAEFAVTADKLMLLHYNVEVA